MTGFKNFEDIESWQIARRLANEIYVISGRGKFSKDFVLRDQMRRASISVLSNIAEGFERGGNAEFIQFLSVAKGSVGEIRAQTYVALDCQYMDQAQFERIHAMATELSRKLAALIAYLRNSGMKGVRYK
ncbi:MAG: four helix bundle protein [Betaproteobacteria bacterium]|nr:four helix bundle protein [Betaproteobacteria bacterium]